MVTSPVYELASHVQSSKLSLASSAVDRSGQASQGMLPATLLYVFPVHAAHVPPSGPV